MKNQVNNLKYFKDSLNKFDILKKPKEQNETLCGLPIGEVGLIVAPGATGKSYFVLNIMLACCGLTQNHLVKKAIKVLYVSLEDRLEDIQRRLAAYSKALDLNEEKLKETDLNFKIIENKSADRLIIKGIPPEDNELWQELNELIQEEKYELIIVDTLIKSYAGFQENDNPDMAMVLSYFNNLAIDNNCSILLLHHTNKGAINPNAEINQSIARGASSLVDNARYVLSLSKNKNDSGVICQSVKTNFYASTSQEYYRSYKGTLIMDEVMELKNVA